MMNVSFVSVLIAPAIYLMSTFGIHIPNNAPADPAADEARFNAVHSQLDPGGTVYGYISVDGDLTAISEWATGKITELKATNARVPFPPLKSQSCWKSRAWTRFPQWVSAQRESRMAFAIKPTSWPRMAVRVC